MDLNKILVVLGVIECDSVMYVDTYREGWDMIIAHYGGGNGLKKIK